VSYRDPQSREAVEDDVVRTVECSRRCPSCDVNLFTTTKRGFALDGCKRCGGVWLTHGDAQRLFEVGNPMPVDLAEMIAKLSARKKPRVAVRTCPDCDAPLHTFAPTTDVVLDACRHHGIWFDRDELAIGVEIAQRRAVAIAEAANKKSDPTVRTTGPAKIDSSAEVLDALDHLFGD
jgi:Zn-finger nucleic acid-binding protein